MSFHGRCMLRSLQHSAKIIISRLLACNYLGDRKSLSIAKNHPKTSQEFSEQFGPSTHEIKGLSKNSHQKVHPNFAKILGRKILGNTLCGPNCCSLAVVVFIFHLNDGQVEKSSFHGPYHFGTSGVELATRKSASFAALVASCAV